MSPLASPTLLFMATKPQRTTRPLKKGKKHAPMNQRHGGDDPRIDKHDQMIDKLLENAVRSEELIKTLASKTQENSNDIRELRKDTIVNSIKTNIQQWAAMLIIASIIGYFFSQIFK